ncbi:MAG TPA: MBL fold metallo-hydrolase [Chloroflexota bacterium]|nr:MBL fold metallo-hydrolase [Chloroflexota bacterium]
MRVTTLTPNLIQLTTLPRVFPVSCYLVREDDGFTLVDTGIRGAKDIIAAAARLGAPIRRIALTHAHADHVGSLDALRAALPEAEILITARDARPLAGDRSLDPGEAGTKLRGGWKTCATKPTRLLKVGDRVGSLEVVAAAGHTPGHVAFLDTRDRALIAGDAFQTRGGIAVAGVARPLFPFVAMGTWHGPTALAGARGLRALNPSLLAVGHGLALTSPAAAMDQAIAAAARKWGQQPAHAG